MVNPVISGLSFFASFLETLPDAISLFIWIPLFAVCVLGILKLVLHHD